MDEFPSSLELTAASALLLLSSDASILFPKTSSISSFKPKDVPAAATTSKKCDNSDEVSSFMVKDDRTVAISRTKREDSDNIDTISSGSTLCRSSLTTDCSVSTHRSRLMASAVARYHATKLKVARRARSKVIYRSNCDRKPPPEILAEPPAKPPKAMSTSSMAVTEGTTIAESSCLSSGGISEISSGRNRGKGVVVEQRRRRGTGPSYLSRRAEAILRVLSCKGCASEVRIRQILGDSPDTSKALRMLLRMEEVRRSGAGGRVDPFIYTIAAESESRLQLV